MNNERSDIEQKIRNRFYGMKSRCYNENERAYKYYGGKGITICDRWLNDIDAFVADMMPTYKDGLSIGRIDGSKGYSPGNCRWATQKQQHENRSSTTYGRMYVIKNETKTNAYNAKLVALKDIAKHLEELHGRSVMNSSRKNGIVSGMYVAVNKDTFVNEILPVCEVIDINKIEIVYGKEM